MKVSTCIFFALLAIYGGFLVRWYDEHESLHWVWDDGRAEGRHRLPVNDDLVFPPGMMWGVATAAHQIDGNATNSNWSEWEKHPHPITKKPTIIRNQKVGQACDHWNRLGPDTALMSKLGINAYRFSLDWAKLEPKAGAWDLDTVAHYHKELDLLLASHILPVLTLHHFTHPIWFENMGAFEKEENIKFFERFALKAFDEFSDKVRNFCTFNEPEVYISMGYFSGTFPPGKKDDVMGAGMAMKNMLEAHVRVYKAIKSRPNGGSSRVGIVKNIFQFDAFRWMNPLDQLMSYFVDSAMNEVILRFFTTGEFYFWMPPHSAIKGENKDAPFSNDFMGLNYYSHYLVKSNIWGIAKGEPLFVMEHRPCDVMTDMPHPIYPEGLYRALVRISKAARGLPVIVTENGIADEQDDRRALYIKRYLYALHRAIQDGVKVGGYFYWSLMDNFEWAEGYDMKFGLYSVNFTTQERSLREGAAPFVRTVKKNALKLI